MFTVRCVPCLLSLVVLLASPAASRGGDWSQWGGRDSRNMISDETGLPDSFTPGGRSSADQDEVEATDKVKWCVKLGSYAYGNPTVAGDRVLVGTDDLTLTDDPRLSRTRSGMVKCLDTATGDVVWQLAIPKREHGLPKGALYGHQHLGVCSSPAIVGDRVYVLSSACEVLCLDLKGLADGNDGPFQDEAQYMVGPDRSPVELGPQDADIIWSYDLVTELDVCPHDAASCSPLVHGDMVYVTTSNGVDVPHKKVIRPFAPSLVVLEKDTGKLVATDDEKIGTRMWHTQWSSPSLGKVAGKTLVFIGGGDGLCYAFEAVSQPQSEPFHLTKAWSYDCNPPHYRLRDGKPIPYYDGDRRKHRGNTNDGTYLGPSQIIATPVFYKNRVYVAIGQDPAHGRGRGMLHCIDATQTGDITESGKIWSYDKIQRSISSATISDSLVYVPDIAGKLHCLSADTGECHWVHDMVSETWGTPVIADGKIYLGNQKKFLILAAGRQPKVLSEVRLGSPMYASAIVANGVLYVTSQRQLWAVEKRR